MQMHLHVGGVTMTLHNFRSLYIILTQSVFAMCKVCIRVKMRSEIKQTPLIFSIKVKQAYLFTCTGIYLVDPMYCRNDQTKNPTSYSTAVVVQLQGLHTRI